MAIAEEPLRGVKFELVCAACGYGVSVRVAPEACPMCRSAVWEHRPWRPFTLLVDDLRPDDERG